MQVQALPGTIPMQMKIEKFDKYLPEPCVPEDTDPLKLWELHSTSMPT